MLKQVNVRGAKLAVYDKGQGPPLLLVHGFPLEHHMWEPQVREFSTTHRVIAVDLRGFGQSSAPEPTAVSTMQDFAADCAGVLDALNVNEPVTFCGLSMGGYIAWQFIDKFPDRVAKLVLCDTRAGADAPEAAAMRLKMAEHVLEAGPELVAAAMLPKLFALETAKQRPELVEQVRQMILHASPAGIAAAQRGMAQRPDVRGRLGSIRVPTQVIVGEHDAISLPHEMEEIAEAIPNAEFILVPDSGHMSTMENSTAVNAAMRGFI